MWAPEMALVKQPLLSDKGIRSTYAVRFWRQALKKYVRGTQGRPNLCFGGFNTYGEPNHPLSSIQPSSAFEETEPTFITNFRCITLHCQLCAISDLREGTSACTYAAKKGPAYIISLEHNPR